MLSVQEVQAAVEQAMVSAGLSPDAPALDLDAFLTMLSADEAAGGHDADADAAPGLQKYASLARPEHSVSAPDALVSLTGVVRRACSTHLLRGLSVSQALSAGDGSPTSEAASNSGGAWAHLVSPSTLAAKDTPVRSVRSRGALAAVVEEGSHDADAVGDGDGDGSGAGGVGRRRGAADAAGDGGSEGSGSPTGKHAGKKGQQDLLSDLKGALRGGSGGA